MALGRNDSAQSAAKSVEKHHFSPRFYLKQWAGADGKLCVFSRWHQQVKAQRKYPAATGFKNNLYTINDLPAEHINFLEHEFMSDIDQYGSNALNLLLEKKTSSLSVNERFEWARFTLSLIQRSPNRVARIYERFDELYSKKKASHQPTNDINLSEHYQLMLSTAESITKGAVIQALINLPEVTKFISKMRWCVKHTPNIPYSLLSSDHPVLMSNGLKHTYAYILLPISPYHLFVATNNLETEQKLADLLKAGQLIPKLNENIVMQAERYVYASDDIQMRFVEKRLAKSDRTGMHANRGSIQKLIGQPTKRTQ